MTVTTVGESLYWSYANLGMAHAAVEEEATKYGKRHFIIRNRLFHGLRSGELNPRSFADDERLKMVLPQACCYCGKREELSLDHLIPRKKGGKDKGENLVWACRSCNSSKCARDILEWFAVKDVFPPLLLLRRYLKLCIEYSIEEGIMSRTIMEIGDDCPFDLRHIPHKYPPPSQLTLWQVPLKIENAT